MEILYENSNIPQNASLILGFFDGVHAGHRSVINNTPKNKKIIVTFSKSPAEYFGKEFKYIYSRKQNYKLLKEAGVDYIYEQEFSNIADISAEDYLRKLIQKFTPRSITTGFNHNFGKNRQGDSMFLEQNQKRYKYTYNCVPPTLIDNKIVSSTSIKDFLQKADLEMANKFLANNFSIESKVISGAKLGRSIGFPTANMKYPDGIVKIPYGVYKVKALGMPAVMNWGIKPTIGSVELLEVHVPNFNQNLYGKTLSVELITKLRDEKSFKSLDELRSQIAKDVEECLKS